MIYILDNFVGLHRHRHIAHAPGNQCFVNVAVFVPDVLRNRDVSLPVRMAAFDHLCEVVHLVAFAVPTHAHKAIHTHLHHVVIES